MSTRFDQEDLCRSHGVSPDFVDAFDKVGIALPTLQLAPLNGLRHPRSGDASGWYFWGGADLSQNADFFEPLHAEHLAQLCPRVRRFLALPAGWRFLIAPTHEDVWYDASLLDV
jgi:hypothetical protein